MPILPLEHVDQPNPQGITLFEISRIPGISGRGRTSYECPSCKSILLENVQSTHLTRIVFRCPSCGLLSRMYEN